jgi:uncharacterized protein (TIGR03083 family)
MTVSASSRAGRLLLTEAAALLPILRSTPAEDFDRPTVLPGWTVRDVLAHCSAALGRAVARDLHGFTPEDNQKDVDERAPSPVPELLAELEDSYVGAAIAMDAAEGRLDGLALGEWVHGGDVRQALGRTDAWASSGLDEALPLLVARSADRVCRPPTSPSVGRGNRALCGWAPRRPHSRRRSRRTPPRSSGCAPGAPPTWPRSPSAAPRRATT